MGVEDRGLEERRGPRHPCPPPGPRSPAAGDAAPARARRAFPCSELRSCLSAPLRSGRDLERPLAALTPVSPASDPGRAHAQPWHFLRPRGCKGLRIWGS